MELKMYENLYQKRKQPIAFFALLAVVLLIVAYFLSGLYKIPGITLANLEEGIFYILQHPLANWWNDKTPAFLLLALLAWMLIVGYMITYYRDFHMDIEHGSADWMEPEAACRELEDEEMSQNRILTQNVRISLQKGLSNNNLLIIGASGSFKTTSVVEQNLLQFAASFLMLDVKGTTQQNLGKAFVKEGYKINSLNFKEPWLSDRYNPFVYIEREDDLLRVVKSLQDSVRPPKAMSAADPFWEDGVRLYLQSLFYYVWLDAKERESIGNMNELLYLVNAENQMLSDGETTKLQVLMDAKAEKYGDDYPPVRDYRKLKTGAAETVGSIILMINAMLGICETAEMKRIFSGNDINIREIGTGVGGDPTKKTAVFLVSPDYNSPYNWVFAMFYTQVCDILMRVADYELKKPLPIRVEMWLDEFYAGAKPANPEVLAGVIRSRNMCMIPIVQSIAQLKATMQEDRWEILMDNMAAVLYLGSGPGAKSTHEYISFLLGNATIDSRSDNVNRGGNGGSSGLNFSHAKRELMTPEEVKRIPSTQAVLFLESRPPIYDTKAIPFDLSRTAGKYKAPDWLKKRYTDALALGIYEHPVYTVYDPVHFRYITVDREKKLQILRGEDARTYKEAAKIDSTIYEYNIEETELLYLSWGKPKHTQEDIEKIYKNALKRESQEIQKLKGLAVLQDVENVPNFGTMPEPDKFAWNDKGTLAELLSRYWDSMAPAEQEEFCLAMDEGLNEEQLKHLMLLPLEQMVQYHRACMIMNKEK